MALFPTKTIRKPRVAYTIVWQPWAIKSAIPTALECAFYILVHVFSRLNSWRIALRKRNTYGVETCILYPCSRFLTFEFMANCA